MAGDGRSGPAEAGGHAVVALDGFEDTPDGGHRVVGAEPGGHLAQEQHAVAERFEDEAEGGEVGSGRFGDGRYSGNNGDLVLSTLVATLKITERLTYVFQNDYAKNDGLPGVIVAAK